MPDGMRSTQGGQDGSLISARVPFVSDADFVLYVGDVRDVLATLPDESVDCCVTSPPYWNLRDYGHEGQIGLEGTPEAFVAALVAVFEQVRRVLRPTGTLWLNLGDSYNAYNGNSAAGGPVGLTQSAQRPRLETGYGLSAKGLKSKDLVGIPWSVALALRAAGWYLRSDIIWSKPNPMPESVTDRPTKAHEYVFLLSKSARYYFDAEAVLEPYADWRNGDPYPNGNRPEQGKYRDVRNDSGITQAPRRSGNKERKPNPAAALGRGDTSHGIPWEEGAGRNVRSVWEIGTQPYAEAHFATFPQELPRRCIKAGTSEYGVCPECGAPWEREIERSPNPTKGTTGPSMAPIGANGETDARYRSHSGTIAGPPRRMLGWVPTCSHDHDTPVPAKVLDPFMGSGTTALVARSLGRHSIGIELNQEYARLCATRLQQQSLLTEGAA